MHNGRHLPPQTLLDYRPPRYKAKTHAFVEHRESPAGQLDRLAIDTVDPLALARRTVSQPYLFLKSLSRV